MLRRHRMRRRPNRKPLKRLSRSRSGESQHRRLLRPRCRASVIIIVIVICCCCGIVVTLARLKRLPLQVRGGGDIDCRFLTYWGVLGRTHHTSFYPTLLYFRVADGKSALLLCHAMVRHGKIFVKKGPLWLFRKQRQGPIDISHSSLCCRKT